MVNSVPEGIGHGIFIFPSQKICLYVSITCSLLSAKLIPRKVSEVISCDSVPETVKVSLLPGTRGSGESVTVSVATFDKGHCIKEVVAVLLTMKNVANKINTKIKF